MIGRGLDHESRANRYLDAMAAVRDMLSGAVPEFQVNAVELSQLLSVLNDEAKAVVIPSRMCDNDEGDDD